MSLLVAVVLLLKLFFSSLFIWPLVITLFASTRVAYAYSLKVASVFKSLPIY